MAASGRPEVANDVKFGISLFEFYLWSKFGDSSFLMHKMLMCIEYFRRYGPAYLKKFLRYNFRKDCSINMKIGHDVAKGNCYSLLKFGAFRLSRS